MAIKNEVISEKENINNYIYHISFQKNRIGIGIFCKIFDEIRNKELALVLITKSNVQIIDNKIEINLKKEKIYLKAKEYFNKNEIAIIEIDEKQDQNQNHLPNISFIRINYSGLNISKNNEFIDKQVYLLDLDADNKKIVNAGIIQEINFETYKINFLCFKKGKTSGGLIIYLDNSKNQLIGVYTSTDDHKYWKNGIFISEYFQDIYEKYHFTEIKINKIEIDNKNKNSKKNKDMNNQNIKNYNNSKNKFNKNINNVNAYTNNMNNQCNQNMNNNNINNQNQQNLYINNNMNYQNNQNLNNNNNINYQQNQNIINENLNNQNINNDYNINNQQINNNNINGQNMINNKNMNYPNIQNLNNNNINDKNINMNYQNNQNINNNMNNQNINNNINYQNMNNNMNNQCNNNLNNQYNNNNMNKYNNNQNINNINNQYNNNNQNMINQLSNEIKNINLNNNMNINNHNQFQNNINANQMNNNLMENYEDVFPYINENKIKISFRIRNNVIKYVSIPTSLRNNELYYTADKINNPNFFEYSDVNSIKLYLNNQLIQNNDEPINKIVFNGAQIFIMETIEDISYYDSLIQNSQNIKKVTIHFIFEKKFNIFFPYNIAIKDMLHGFFAKNKIPIFNRTCFSFHINSEKLALNDDTLLFNKRIIDGSNIDLIAHSIIQNGNNMEFSKNDFPGKKLNISLINNNDELIGEIYAGSLQQIKTFYNKLKQYLSKKNIDLTGKIVILHSGAEVIKNELDERTFSSFGILNDFKCKIDADKNILFFINDIMKNK